MHLKVALLILTITAAVVHLGLIDRPLPQPMVVLPHPEDIQVQPPLPRGVSPDYMRNEKNVLMFKCIMDGPVDGGLYHLTDYTNSLYLYVKPCWST